MDSPTDLFLLVDYQHRYISHVEPKQLQGLAKAVKVITSSTLEKGSNFAMVRHTYEDSTMLIPQTVMTRNQKVLKDIPLQDLRNTFEIAYPIEQAKASPVFSKWSYSAFYSPGFKRYIAEKNICHIYIYGLFLDICIDATIRDAYQQGINSTVISDATVTRYFPKDEYINYASDLYNTSFLLSSEIS